MDEGLRAHAEAARGFMPPDEGLALHDAAVAAAGGRARGADRRGRHLLRDDPPCTSAPRPGAVGTVVVTVDHHRGSEENQPGWEWHEPDLVDPELGVIDTLPTFRRTIHAAGLEDVVVAVVGNSPVVAGWWSTPAAMVFIDGGHGEEPARTDYRVLVAGRGARGLAGDPRRVPRPRRRRSAALRADLPPGDRLRSLHRGVRGTGSLRVLRRAESPVAGRRPVPGRAGPDAHRDQHAASRGPGAGGWPSRAGYTCQWVR